LAEILVFGVLAYLFYLMSIGRAGAWGATVKSAFDLYRRDLLKELGYNYVPRTIEEERDMWSSISRQLIFGDSPFVVPAEYLRTGTFARAEPGVVPLETARGVSTLGANAVMSITISVRNIDAYGRSANNVVVADRLPEGYDYLWDSAQVGERKVPIAGSNPYYFRVADVLTPGGEVTLTYQGVPRFMNYQF
jgi:uncharacterized repeat protein (TIGR01451 family)